MRGCSSPRTCSGRASPACRWRTCAATCEHVADRRLAQLGIEPLYGSPRTRSAFMELQDVQELSNFFERRVSAYQVGVTGEVAFDADF